MILSLYMHISLAQIKEHLKETGRKDSRLKNIVLEMIYESFNYLSVSDILGQLNQEGISANKTSVYRIIEMLITEDIVYELDFLDGKKRYAIKRGPEYTHLICNACGQVTSFRNSETINLIKESIRREYQFGIDTFGVQFFGKCQECNQLKEPI